MENEATGRNLRREHKQLTLFSLIAGIVLLLVVIVMCNSEGVAIYAVTWLAPLTVAGVINLLGHVLMLVNKTILVARAGLYLAILAVVYFIVLYLILSWITSWAMN